MYYLAPPMRTGRYDGGISLVEFAVEFARWMQMISPDRRVSRVVDGHVMGLNIREGAQMAGVSRRWARLALRAVRQAYDAGSPSVEKRATDNLALEVRCAIRIDL